MFRRGIFVLCRTLADQESKQLERSFSLFLTNQPNLRSKSCETVKFLSTLNQEKTSKKTNQLNVKTVVNDLRAYNNFSEISVKENIKLFEKYKVKNVMENKELLLSSTDDLKAKLEIIAQMKPKRIDDFLPLAKIGKRRLISIQRHCYYEAFTVPEKNRIYYFSKELKIEPMIISKYFAKHPFIFDIEFKLLQQKVKLLLDNSIPAINILQDLCIVERSLEVLIERLECLKAKDINQIMPWMLKCESKILKRAILIRQEQGPSINYLARQLNWPSTKTEAILKKYPNFQRYRMHKVKEMYDLLTNKLGVTDIEKYLPIFSFSTKRVEKRFLELKALAMEDKISLFWMNEKRYRKELNKL